MTPNPKASSAIHFPARHSRISSDCRWLLLLVALTLSLGAPAVCADEIMAWGDDSEGQVSNIPTGTDFTAVAAGGYWGCALTVDGSIAAWGDDLFGAVSNAATGTGYTAIAAGRYHGYALAADGSISAWGYDFDGQVSNTPAGTGFTNIAAGSYFGCALAADGTIAAWGDDTHGQVSNAPLGSGYTAVSAGNFWGCAVAADGSIAAWGQDLYGKVSAAPAGANFAAVSAGQDHGYALATDGSIAAWGRDSNGQVTNTPASTGFTSVSAGNYHGFALASDDTITAWGSNGYGVSSSTPTGNAFSSVATATYWGMALHRLDTIVNRTTGWTYDTLQNAIDAAAPDDVILIDGGVHPGVVIDKPIYLTGVHSNRPLLRAYLPGEFGPGTKQYPTVSLVGPGAGTVTLSGIDIGGENAYGISKNAPGIQGGGFDELRILHCDVHPPEWGYLDGVANEAPAIDVDVGYVLIEDSTVTGGSADHDGGVFFSFPDGGAGVITTGDIGVFDSTMTGGHGMNGGTSQSPPDCATVDGGFGGPAVSTPGTLYEANSSLAAGQGSVVEIEDFVLGTFTTCYLPDGPDVTAGNEVIMPDDIIGSGPIVANQDWTLTWYAAASGSWLVLGSDPMAPLQLYPEGFLFMNPAKMTLLPAPASGINMLTHSIGPSANLIGYPIVIQRYNAIEGLSRPVFGTFLEE